MARLKKIKSGVFSRGLALAKVSVSVGAKAASHAMGGLFSSEDEKSERLKELVISQVNVLAKELGQLKGSLMKMGQMLSIYGEHFLPPEANAFLKSLQSQSPPLEWAAIERVLREQLGPEKMALLEIDPEPLASASLGQVHGATRKSDGRRLAMKIQYPGVDRAIDSDLNSLRSLLSMAKLIPAGPNFDEAFREVKAMLHQEVDYRKELEFTDFFRARLGADPRYIVPATVPEFSGPRILTTTLEEGVPIDSGEVLDLPEERRNAIAIAALELYFRELFEFRLVQTDPHFGNYRVRLGKEGALDRLVLLDFGAVRKVPQEFLKNYSLMARGAIDDKPDDVARGAERMGLLKSDDPEGLRRQFIELCYLIVEPFSPPGHPAYRPELTDARGNYDWGKSDLPKRAARHGAKIVFSFRLRVPPRELVFLDRKMGGMFIFMQVLGAHFRGRDLLESYLKSVG